ncbi:hypothetical protein MHK_009578 [Candidatus Magnetomorum sp. HK-1]|nr:hypothetical protein MHK_009578 [Candidatus Magnetomorum sp. HK-1]
MFNKLERIIFEYSELLIDFRRNLKIWNNNKYKSLENLYTLLTLKGYLSIYSSCLKTIAKKETDIFDKKILRLQKIKINSYETFKKLILSDKEKINQLLKSLNILSESEELIGKVLTSYETFILSENENKKFSLDIMKKYAHDFLNVFFDEKILCKELNNQFDSETLKDIGFIKSIETTEQLLRSSFYYWSEMLDTRETFLKEVQISNFLPKKEFWWMFDNPLSRPYKKLQDLSESVEEKLFALCSKIDFSSEMSKRFPDSCDCPGDEKLVLFASDEISDKDALSLSVKKHLLICDQCAYEVAILQSIIQEPILSNKDKPFILPTSVKIAMEKEFSAIIKKKQRLKDKVSLITERITEKIQSGKETLKAISDYIAEELIIQITSLWEPQLVGQVVTASDISKQMHKFNIDQGKITISCNWQPAYENDEEYLTLTWKANISISCNLWVRFEDPKTHEIFSEKCLGSSMTGEENFTSKDLCFDPSEKRWAVAIILTEKKL